MSLTLLEAKKLVEGEVKRAAIIEIYAKSSPILAVLPFEDIEGNALAYNVEESLPGIGFRGVNESYSESTGILNPQTDPLKIMGGDFDVDRFIVRTMGVQQRAVQETMKIKAASLRWTEAFIKGDSDSDQKEFNGLQARITGNQLIAAGTTDGGDALSLAKLDELIDAVDSPTHLAMSKAMRRLFTQAARDYSVGGFITTEKDEWGRPVTLYNDLPILVLDKDNENNDILAFDEATNHASATATGTSIYCLSLGDGMLTGIQNGILEAEDLGQLQTAPCYRTRVEWYAGIAVFHPRGCAAVVDQERRGREVIGKNSLTRQRGRST